MTDVPSYPVVDVDLRADGSAHVNIAGDHTDLPPGDLPATRAAVIAIAQQVAAALGRPVRMRAADPQGIWHNAVHPDGTVTEAGPQPAGRVRAASTTRRAPRTGAIPRARRGVDEDSEPTADPQPRYRRTAPLSSPDPAEAAPAEPSEEPTRLSRPRMAVLHVQFSTGQGADIHQPLLVGRGPAAEPGTTALALSDASRTVSKTHLRLDPSPSGATVTDLGSANGVLITRAGIERDLAPGVPFELRDGDALELGDVTATVRHANAAPTGL